MHNLASAFTEFSHGEACAEQIICVEGCGGGARLDHVGLGELDGVGELRGTGEQRLQRPASTTTVKKDTFGS